MSGLQVGSVQREEVGKVRGDRAQVGAGVVIAPRLAQAAARAASCLVGGDKTQHVEAGGQHQHVGFPFGAVRSADRLAGDLGDRLVDQLHAGVAQHPVPAVVHQHALAEWRVGGQHPVQQLVSPVAQFVDHVPGEVRTVGIVLRVEGTLRVLPAGVLLQGRVDAVVERPAQAHPVPGPVQRHRLEQGSHGVGHRLAELLERRCPMVGALVDRERLHIVLDLGGCLHAACPVSHDRHPLATDIGIGGPARRVPGLAAPGLKTVDVGADRRVEDARSADDDVGLDDLRGSVRILRMAVRAGSGRRCIVPPPHPGLVGRGAQPQPSGLPATLVVSHMAYFCPPDLTLGVVADALHRRVEADAVAHIEVVRHLLEVAVQLVAQAEVHLPVVRRE